MLGETCHRKTTMNDRCCAQELDTNRCTTLAAVAKALAHPTRLRILRILLAQDGCLCGAIVDDLGCAQSTVSQHLKQMKEAGLIRGTIDGPRVCYCLDQAVWSHFQATIASLTPVKDAP